MPRLTIKVTGPGAQARVDVELATKPTQADLDRWAAAIAAESSGRGPAFSGALSEASRPAARRAHVATRTPALDDD